MYTVTPTIYEVVSEASKGKELFDIWVDVSYVSDETLKEVVSKHLPPACACVWDFVQNVSFKGVPDSDKVAAFFKTVGELALDYKLLTVSATVKCLNNLLGRNMFWGNGFELNVCVRTEVELGICIAKLAARLKFANNYTPLDKEKELAEIEKLRGFREV